MNKAEGDLGADLFLGDSFTVEANRETCHEYEPCRTRVQSLPVSELPFLPSGHLSVWLPLGPISCSLARLDGYPVVCRFLEMARPPSRGKLLRCLLRIEFHPPRTWIRTIQTPLPQRPHAGSYQGGVGHFVLPGCQRVHPHQSSTQQVHRMGYDPLSGSLSPTHPQHFPAVLPRIPGVFDRVIQPLTPSDCAKIFDGGK